MGSAGYNRGNVDDADVVAMREFASRICKDYLNGAWKSVTPNDIGFKHISGGLSNLLYHITLPAHLMSPSSSARSSPTTTTCETSCPDVPSEVLIRLYGQMHGGERALEALITESVVFTLLSERGLGPKLHGIFPGGRIEQYIKARPLTTNELGDAHLSALIARKMAAIHTMEVPLHKEPCWLWDTIDRWLQRCCDRKFPTTEGVVCYLTNGGRRTIVPEVLKRFFAQNLRQEVVWLRQRLEMENSPVVFCHNDMQEGNILIHIDDDDDDDDNNNTSSDHVVNDVVLIDFEYCSYNYRAFDIANHFIEWTYEYIGLEPPFFAERPDNYPTRQQRLHFINTYQSELNAQLNLSHTTVDDAEKILKEIEVFTLASHLMWGLWGIINAETSKIPFGYLEYAASRIGHYMDLKHRLQQSSANKRKVDNLD